MGSKAQDTCQDGIIRSFGGTTRSLNMVQCFKGEAMEGFKELDAVVRSISEGDSFGLVVCRVSV